MPSSRAVWRNVTRQLEQSKSSFEAEGTTEEKAREEYRKIAERRVRLGLILSEIGNENQIRITDEELRRADDGSRPSVPRPGDVRSSSSTGKIPGA